MENVLKHLISGFRTMRLCPYEPQQALKKTPCGLLGSKDKNSQQKKVYEGMIDLLKGLRGVDKSKDIR